MADTTYTPALTPQIIAAHLSWLLSNSNAELEVHPEDAPSVLLDAAFDTGLAAAGEFQLYASVRDPETGAAGERDFIVRVELA
jgi:hypothetical protein